MNDRKSYLCICCVHIAGFLFWITQKSSFNIAFSLWLLLVVSYRQVWREDFLLSVCYFLPEKLWCLLWLLTWKSGQGRELRMRKPFFKIIPTNSMKSSSHTSVLKDPLEFCCHACQILRHHSVIFRDVIHLRTTHLNVRLHGDLAPLKPCYWRVHAAVAAPI